MNRIQELTANAMSCFTVKTINGDHTLITFKVTNAKGFVTTHQFEMREDISLAGISKVLALQNEQLLTTLLNGSKASFQAIIGALNRVKNGSSNPLKKGPVKSSMKWALEQGFKGNKMVFMTASLVAVKQIEELFSLYVPKTLSVGKRTYEYINISDTFIAVVPIEYKLGETRAILGYAQFDQVV